MRYYSEVTKTLRNGLAMVASGVGAVVRAVTAGGHAVKRAVTVAAGPCRTGRVAFAAPATRVSDATVAVGRDRSAALLANGGMSRGGGAVVLAIKRTFFGLGAAFFLAGFLPSSTEAQYMGCADCKWYTPPREEGPSPAGEDDEGWMYCSYDPAGEFNKCVTPEYNQCHAQGGCAEGYALDLTGIAVREDAENEGHLAETGTLRRACDSAITAWRPSRAEATRQRRKLSVLVI